MSVGERTNARLVKTHNALGLAARLIDRRPVRALLNALKQPNLNPNDADARAERAR